MDALRCTAALACLVPVVAAPAADAPKPGEPSKVSFKAAVDGTTQYYVELLPKDYRPGEALHVLVALHAAGGDGWEYFRQPAPQCRATRDLATRHRLLLVGPDYRGPFSWMGPGADDDVAQVIREVKARYKVGKVVVAGASMGGTAALTFTALHPELVDGVVSQCSLADLSEPSPHSGAIAAAFGGTPGQKPGEYRRRSAGLAAERFTMPVAIWTGGQDQSVPPRSAMRLAEALQSRHPGRVLHIHRTDAGHAPGYEDTVRAYEFVLRAVLGARSSGPAPEKPPRTSGASPREVATPTHR
jgi:pimeloyl-ACP methyl ester carboxylesterase